MQLERQLQPEAYRRRRGGYLDRRRTRSADASRPWATRRISAAGQWTASPAAPPPGSRPRYQPLTDTQGHNPQLRPTRPPTRSVWTSGLLGQLNAARPRWPAGSRSLAGAIL